MTSLDLKKLSEHADFIDRVHMNLIYVAHQIVGEAANTPDTAKRQICGVAILNNTPAFVGKFCQSLAVQATIAQNISIAEDVLSYTGSQVATNEFDKMDIEIQSVISAVFNDIAGIYNL